MAEVVTMPRLSDTMTDGTVAKWHKQVGDKVSEGDILAEIETDKATMEFESFQEGVLLHIGVAEGDTAPVDSILAILGEEGEDISLLLNSNSASVNEVVEVSENVKEKAVDNSGVSAEDLGVEVVTMPRLSDTMTDGTVAKWHKQVGDKVVEGDILAEIETDKATMEFESFQEGTLLYIGVAEGQTAAVDSVLAILGEAGTDVSAIVNNGGVKKESEKENSVEEAVKQEAPKVEEYQGAYGGFISFEEEPKVEVEKEIVQAVNSDGRVLISPLAQKLAEEKGVNISNVSGTGDGGRIVKRDIDNYKMQPVVVEKIVEVSVPSTSSVSYEEKFTEEKVSQMRKTIAKRLVESKNVAPHYYLMLEINMDEAINSRKAINNMPDTKVSFNDMVIKASAMALKKHPQVNTSWRGDVVRKNEHVNIGVAVAVEDGLLVPVVRFADTKQLTAISAEVKDYALRAKSKKLMPEDWEGSTFTVSNLGMFGIEEFTSIINQPDSAILSVGAIIQKPIVKNGEIVVGNTMKVTLAADHRTVDGATGAKFLQTFKMYLENPVTMIA